MAFADIPIRQNGLDHIIEAAWFNTIRSNLIVAFGSGGYIAVASDQVIAASGTFSFDAEAYKPLLPCSGDGGAVTSSSTPFGTSHGFQSGKEIILLGLSDTNTVTLESNDIDEGVISNGKIILSKYEQVILIYNASLKRFIRKE